MKDLHIPYIVQFYHVFAIKLGLNLGPLAQDTANSLSSNFWCRPALRCWHSRKVCASVGDRRWHFVGSASPFGWKICDLNASDDQQTKQKGTPCQIWPSFPQWFDFNYWFPFLFTVFAVIWVESEKKNDLYISLISLTFISLLCQRFWEGGWLVWGERISRSFCLPNCASYWKSNLPSELCLRYIYIYADIYIYKYIYIVSYTSMYEANHLAWG